MVKVIVPMLMLTLITASGWAAEKVRMVTSLGDIVLELNSDKAPGSVANFLAYVDADFYDRTIFHRVIEGFMIQGGGYTTEMTQKPTMAPIQNEAANSLKNQRGTIAMARTSQIDSATSQFFINTVDNPFLDHRSSDSRGYGYAVFGRVVEGMEVVDRIAGQETINKGGAFANLPRKTVEILDVMRLK